LAAESLTPVLLFDGHYFVYIMKKVKKKNRFKKVFNKQTNINVNKNEKTEPSVCW